MQFRHSEERIDRKGRPYFFMNGHDWDTVVSATVFRNPNSNSATIYVWWQRTDVTEDGVSRRRWVTRYIMKSGFVSVSKKRKGNHYPASWDRDIVHDAMIQATAMRPDLFGPVWSAEDVNKAF